MAPGSVTVWLGLSTESVTKWDNLQALLLAKGFTRRVSIACSHIAARSLRRMRRRTLHMRRESTWRWMLNDCEVPIVISSPPSSRTVSDTTTAELLEHLAAAGAGASAEGLKVAYHLAHVIQPERETAAALDAMLVLMGAQAKEMSSVRCAEHLQYPKPV